MSGAIVLRRKLSRGQIAVRFANLPRCLVGMEACVGSHHLSRRLQALGHDVRIMPALYVKPYLKGQKNDFRDAEAIAEAVQRPTMRFVQTKTVEQLDLQALHRLQWLDENKTWVWDVSKLAKNRNRLVNLIGRVFCVVNKLRIGELGNAVGRSHRLKIVPPRIVLISICRRLNYLTVENEIVSVVNLEKSLCLRQA
jgi:hypothetical protein